MVTANILGCSSSLLGAALVYICLFLAESRVSAPLQRGLCGGGCGGTCGHKAGRARRIGSKAGALDGGVCSEPRYAALCVPTAPQPAKGVRLRCGASSHTLNDLLLGSRRGSRRCSPFCHCYRSKGRCLLNVSIILNDQEHVSMR